MAYLSNNMVSRAGYGDWWDTVTGVLTGGVKLYSAEQQAQGAAAQSNRDLQAAIAAQQGGIGTGTVLLVGGAALVAVLLLRKKKD